MQLFECLTAFQVIKNKLLCHSQNNGLPLPKFVGHILYLHDLFPRWSQVALLYFRCGEGVFTISLQEFAYMFVPIYPKTACVQHVDKEGVPRWQGSWGQHGAHLGPTGPRWAPCWSHELCYLGNHRNLWESKSYRLRWSHTNHSLPTKRLNWHSKRMFYHLYTHTWASVLSYVAWVYCRVG